MSTPLRNTGVTPTESDELLLADLIRPIARRWRMVVAVPLACGLLALGLSLVWPRSYTAKASFTPEQAPGGSLANALSGAAGGLGALVGQIGGLPTSLGNSGASPDFFAGVLESRELLVSTLTSTFPDPDHPGGRRTLLEILRPRGATPERRLGNALRKLADKTGPTVDRRSGIVTLSVTLRDPNLAAGVANRMTELLNVYNLERRQFSSRAQRRFIADRLVQAEDELRAAERARSAFLVENRFYENSPVLQETATRLTRDMRIHQDIVLGLRKSFEDARIAEARDTPVLTIIDHAAPPDRPSNPRPVLWTAVATVVGLIGACAAAFAMSAGATPTGALRAADVGDGSPAAEVLTLRDPLDGFRPEGRVTTAQRP